MSSSVREKDARGSAPGPGDDVPGPHRSSVGSHCGAQPLEGGVRFLQLLRHLQNPLVSRKCTLVLFCFVEFGFEPWGLV